MKSAAAKALGDVSGFHAIFFEEADEHLATIEAILLRLDHAVPGAEDLNAIFRAAHSIKGSSAMLGFPEISALTHVMENLLDLLRMGERALMRRDVDAMLQAGDVLRLQLAFRRGQSKSAPDMKAAEEELRALASLGQGPAGSPQERHFAVRLGPLANPIEQAELEMMLTGLGEMGSVRQGEVRNVSGGDIQFEVSLAGTEANLRSVLSLVVAAELIDVVPVEQAANSEPQPPASGPGVSGCEVQVHDAEDEEPGFELFVPLDSLRAGRQAEQSAAALPGEANARPAEGAAVGARAEAASIRVSVEKIDHLVNLVGELVITEAMLSQQQGGTGGKGQQAENPGLRDLARHTRNLQEAVMSIRMVPISAVFSRFPRLVRELSKRLGKEIELKLSGETTELDRGLIEKIVDPLTHLVRNAIDHGMEAPEARLAAGKARSGSVSLSASQRGSNIVIEVRDDGRGLDRERILVRAAERGMAIAPNASDNEIWQLIFEPGFSTAESVTEVSGRGVGMDVVRRNIQSLRGNVILESRAGAGTTVTVSVPLTLAIVEAMSVAVGDEIYALPLASVIETRRVGPDEIQSISGREATLRVRNEYLPVKRLGKGDIAVVVEADRRRTALMVDALVGQQQVVVKNLEANFRKVPGIAGATIMGDGRVALILDVSYHVSSAAAGEVEICNA